MTNIRQRIRRGWRRARGREAGAVSIEFAILAPTFIFFSLLVLELSIVLFGESLLDNAVSDSARLIRTGQAQKNSADASKFKQQVCARLPAIIDCTKLSVHVKTFTDFASINAPPVDKDTFKRNPYSHGGPQDIVLVRAFYPYKPITPFMSWFFTNTEREDTDDDGNVYTDDVWLIHAAAVFRSEPF